MPIGLSAADRIEQSSKSSPRSCRGHLPRRGDAHPARTPAHHGGSYVAAGVLALAAVALGGIQLAIDAQYAGSFGRTPIENGLQGMQGVAIGLVAMTLPCVASVLRRTRQIGLSCGAWAIWSGFLVLMILASMGVLRWRSERRNHRGILPFLNLVPRPCGTIPSARALVTKTSRNVFVAQKPSATMPGRDSLHEPPEPRAHDPPTKPQHDPPGDPAYEPPQPRTHPIPNPASDPPRGLPKGVAWC